MPTINEIINWCNENDFQVLGSIEDEEYEVNLPREIVTAKSFNLSILTKKFKDSLTELIHSTQARVIVIDKELVTSINIPNNKLFLVADKPKKALIKYCEYFLKELDSERRTNEHYNSTLIEKGAEIAESAIIGPGTYISSNCKVGENCVIGANNVIKNTTIGDCVFIGSNNTLGENGFGYSKNDKGEFDLFPHYGRVVIGEHVHIGNNTCIDRGSLSDTVLKKGVKVDNLVHIAHNVQIGENSLIIASSMIAGSVTIGKNCWIAPGSNIRNAIQIGDNCTIGMGSTVVKNVSSGQTVVGSPAVPLDEFKSRISK